MAYISTANVAVKREALAKAFSGWKFSVRAGANNLSIDVNILSAPLNFAEGMPPHFSVNHYHLGSNFYGEQLEALEKIVAILNDGNHDRSDAMSDHSDVGFYVHLSIGNWNKPFAYNPASPAQAKKAA